MTKRCSRCNTEKPLETFRVYAKRGTPHAQCRACENEYQKTYYRANGDTARERKRRWMSDHRRENKDAINSRNRHRYANEPAVRAKLARSAVAYRERHFFAYRARKIPGITAYDLWRLWKTQRGLCGLTGRTLDRSDQVDHVLPQARGGTHAISNLRWVCESANIAKRHMTDEEFAVLCGDVLRWIGERILKVEAALEVQS